MVVTIDWRHFCFFKTMFNKLYAICLLVEDYEKSLVFYRDTLGLRVNSQDTQYTDFQLGESLFAIFQKDAATAMFPKKHMSSGSGCVIAFPVENVATACTELQARGVAIFAGTDA